VGGALVRAALFVGKDAVRLISLSGVVSGAVGAALTLTSSKMRFLKYCIFCNIFLMR
jgi:hypothetical protein